MWWLMPVTLILGRLRQENCLQVQGQLGLPHETLFQKNWIFDPMYSLIHLISRWLEIFYIFFVCDAGMKPLTCFFLCPGGTKAWLDGPIMLDRGFATALHPSPQPWKFLRVVSIRAAASDSRRHQATTLAFKEASSECLRSSCINSALSL